MHICLVSEHFHKRPGGPRTACLGLARGFNQLGHHVSLISIMAHENTREALPGGGEARIRRYGWKLIPVSMGRGRFYAREITRIHKERPIDVVLAQGWEAADAAQPFCSKHGVPWLLNPRSCSKDRPGNWRNIRAQRFFDASNGMIAISEYAAADWRTNLARPQGSIVAALNGVDPGILEGPVEAPFTVPETPIILSMGGLRPGKGHHWIARALAGVHEDFRWVIAGDGREADNLKAQVSKLGLSPRTIFTGNVEGAHWRWLYRNAAIFTLFPVYPEACGNAYLEAQAAGLPIVASNAGALPEVTSPQSALLIDVSNMRDEGRVIGQLREAYSRLLADPALRASMGAAGKNRIAGMTWKACARKYLAATPLYVPGAPAPD
ncbi:MAG: glycosyltransferase family 4 protein [Planctomycetes bacterium]|nr:glycosyltransferase family 4 protein [Planctomycetota bacterium]